MKLVAKALAWGLFIWFILFWYIVLTGYIVALYSEGIQ